MKICAHPDCNNPCKQPEHSHCSVPCYKDHRRTEAWEDIPLEQRCGYCGRAHKPRKSDTPSKWMKRATCGRKKCLAEARRIGAKRKLVDGHYNQQAATGDIEDIEHLIARQFIGNASEIRRAERLYAESSEDYAGKKGARGQRYG